MKARRRRDPARLDLAGIQVKRVEGDLRSMHVEPDSDRHEDLLEERDGFQAQSIRARPDGALHTPSFSDPGFCGTRGSAHDICATAARRGGVAWRAPQRLGVGEAGAQTAALGVGY